MKDNTKVKEYKLICKNGYIKLNASQLIHKLKSNNIYESQEIEYLRRCNQILNSCEHIISNSIQITESICDELMEFFNSNRRND
ncbi:MAG: hypothetical protein K0R73_1423 [Candidatus Midichloriaceae bacterium]|jgi:hypothetical protein|nr:hypothetical protein [Candidatus Midichloriaceae bacterium]